MSDAVLVALIAAIGGIVIASISGMALMQSKETHKLINSRMTELLALTRKAAKAEGVIVGEQAHLNRTSTETPDA